MASTDDCIKAMAAAAGRDLTDDEMEALQTQLQARTRYEQVRNGAIDMRDAALKAADSIGADLKTAAFIERRNALINAAIRAEKVEWIQSNFGNRPAEGITALLVGVNRAKQGARNSVMSVQKTLHDKFLSGFVADLEKTGSAKLFSGGTMDRDVTRALWALGRENEADLLKGIPGPAQEIARVINKWQEYTRVTANEAGAWIGKEAGYIVKQSHDMLRIRHAGFDTWRAAALEHFDIPRMMTESGADNVDEMLNGIFRNLASGDHMKPIASVAESPFKGPGNLAKRISQDRVVHFKDADAWFDYNQAYGVRSLREAVAGGIARGAQQIGLLRQLGTNPGGMVETLRNDLIQASKKAGEFGKVDDLKGKADRHDQYLSAIDGRMNIPGNALWARRGQNLRAWQSLAKLGGMILSQFNDIAVYGSEAKYQGRGFLSGMGESMAGLGTNLKTEERKDLLASLGVFFESSIGEIARTGSFEDAGALTKSQRLFFKLNLGQWWTEKMRAAAAMGMSHHMALQTGKVWEALAPEYRRVLSLYDIDGPKWDVIRQSGMKQVDGRNYVAPDTITQLPDDVVRGYLEANELRAGPKDIAAAKEDLATKLQTYLNDRTTFFQLEPDNKTRALLLQGTKPGTWMGEFARFAMQFKSFTGAYMQKIMGRELYGRGFEGTNPIKALAGGNGEAWGLVSVVAMSTLFGYGSMLAKDMMRGQTPRLPNGDAAQDTKLFLAAMAQGGGMGLMGDFLFGTANRFGGGVLASMAGPTAGFANDLVNLYQAARDEALTGKGSTAAEALRVAMNNTPYLNLFYTRIALDYLLFYRIQEWMNPGYLSRMEQRVRTQNNQTFILPPSQVIR
ncbi:MULTISPECIES: hypothetical protein [unclassified Achromobacter]|uniref:hypothetical protein n=1 Tax=unclassified Achromobacter TaxID=2626865 RepID=UPI000B519062|nr:MULTISPECIES: hypothetical protein [unclassified Achromobacter]OWT68095.1 hypothetical protein CEY05_29105 [Achromobacter sp. HZ34]OWT69932.1 hypothetical protein CEY04_27935 [Achromobacter sp. HZ28]